MFFVFRDSYVIYIRVMNILCTFHVAISWLCNNYWVRFSFPKIEKLVCSWTALKAKLVGCFGFTVGLLSKKQLSSERLRVPSVVKKKQSYTKTAAKEAVLLPVKSSSDDDPGFRHGFGAEASLPLTQGAPAVSHNTTRLYWMMFNLYECHIRSDAVTALF